MKRLHFMILRMLPGPFIGWLLVIMFLLLMQFLMKYLPDIAGKGLPYTVVFELVAYNLAYMLVLAVPMAVLVSFLMVYGRLAETRAYVVIKSSGISFLRVVWPTMLLGLLLTGGMIHFNNVILPEANFRARNLWQDIRKKKPAFDLQAGSFYQGLNRYSILVQQIDSDEDLLHDVVIYDYTASNRGQTILKARTGRVVSEEYHPFVDLHLENGEVHKTTDATTSGDPERYERLAFDRYRFRLDLSDFVFERSDPTQGFRSDRTMPTSEMARKLDSLTISIDNHSRQLIDQDLHLATSSDAALQRPLEESSARLILKHDEQAEMSEALERDLEVLETAIREARARRSSIDDARRTLGWEQQRANRYRVEIHKKYSIAVACFIFALVAAPLGVGMRRGSLGMSGATATAIFLFYWITLVQGEKKADIGDIEPWIGMWTANAVLLVVALLAFLYVAFDLRATSSLLSRFRQIRRS